MTDMDVKHHTGLRERKKARTRAAIKEHAFRLFREQGYEDTTVDQIAAAAEVSPSTFFRYFPTKEDVVLQDDMDVRVFEAADRQPPDLPPVAVIRAALREVAASFTAAEWEQFREATVLQMTVPEVRARALEEMNRMLQQMADTLAKRTGRAPDDMAVRTFAGAVLGVMMSTSLPYLEPLESASAGAPITADIFERMDEALALLEAGLPL
jgi:AcrR family transcriptional regulator